MPINKKTIPLKPYPSNVIFFFFFSSFSLFILDCSSFTCTKSHILFIINWLYCKLCEFMTCILVTSRITFYIHTLFICTCWCMICVVPFYKILQLILLILFGLHFFFTLDLNKFLVFKWRNIEHQIGKMVYFYIFNLFLLSSLIKNKNIFIYSEKL